ncbi:class II fructose-bisphosphate aldolase [Virgibacillus pantothenticus]|uniref:class II fructose-bisphosphate aldolase n=1 Tax=Virgibacillus pantothenticus TaxID=1473 RepID=UPI000970A5E9|nr:class II fructose-bisphosphate aldolase [Virgibacillus pantothenticus]
MERTRFDSLGVAVETGHSVYETKQHLDFNRLERIKNLVDIPIVLYGVYGIAQEDVQKCISLECGSDYLFQQN